MRALAGVFLRSQYGFTRALIQAESGDKQALALALEMLDRLPAVGKRQLLLSYNNLSREAREVA
jgi:hypothetical protein